MQLVLEVDGARSAGWTWSEVIEICADGIASDPYGEWTQLLEISTSDHTFRFLAPADKVGAWVSALPTAGRNCFGALKESVWGVESLPQDGRRKLLSRGSDSGLGAALTNESDEKDENDETVVRNPTGSATVTSDDGHFGGYGRMGEESKDPRLDAGRVEVGPSDAPGLNRPDGSTASHDSALAIPISTPFAPSALAPPAPIPPAPIPPAQGMPAPFPPAQGMPAPFPPAQAMPSPAMPAPDNQAGESTTNGSARRSRHAKRRLFGRSARSENRHLASGIDSTKPGSARHLHAQPLTVGEVVRNLLTWTPRSRGKVDVAGTHIAPESAGLAGLGSAASEHARRESGPKRHYSPRRRYATLGLGILIAGTTAAGTAAAFQPGSGLAAPHVIGPVVPDSPQTHGLVTALAPPPKLRFHLARAKTKPKPAPATLLSGPSLQSHEIFAFAPYWTLPTASSFNVADMTTLSYFGVDVNANGTIDESGDGWTGYQSQDLSDLISRAHAAGDRVVLTAECFSQATLNAVTSDPTAGTTLGNQLVKLVEAKNLDGINIDFEGEGPADQKGLDRLMSQVSTVVRRADSHWQITMDTYASSAGDPDGFYDIRGLASSVDAFFVMAYQMGGPEGSASSEFSGSNFTSGEALKEYMQVVPASQVILGLPFYGYSWTTTGPSATASATGPATPVSDSAIVTAGKSVYWSDASHTAFISYKVGKVWHQTWFEDATSLSERAQLAGSAGTRGVGIWALGMEGNDPAMLAALVGNSPVIKDYAPSPVGTNSPSGPATTSTTRASTTTTTGAKSTTSTSTTATTTPQSTTTTGPTTTTTEPSTTTTEPSSTTTSTTDPESTTTTADVPTTTSY